MPPTIFGLPVHPLIVHAVVVLVPLAALLVLASALVPQVRRWAGWLTPVAAVVALVLVPLATDSGENLEHAVGESPLVEQHAELADQMLPWVAFLAVAAIALVWWDRRRGRASARPGERRSSGPRAVLLVLVALSVIAGLGTSVTVVRIGHSGAKAVWSDSKAASSQSGGEGQSDDH